MKENESEAQGWNEKDAVVDVGTCGTYLAIEAKAHALWLLLFSRLSHTFPSAPSCEANRLSSTYLRVSAFLFFSGISPKPTR